ncbi:MAG: c-type cytochrome [Nitrospinae bacterium]|nr:c-type cytochrome [Nitrospinota bacterium]
MNIFRSLFITALPLFFIITTTGDLLAGPMMMRHGKGPGIHPHSMGFGGKGICPQPRVMAQAPDDIYHLKNPLLSTQQNQDAGESLYRVDSQPTACKICHGLTGNGFGMMAPGLNPPPRNFACAESMKEIPDGQLFWVIKNGSQGTGMPAYPELTEKQIWQLVLHLRGLSQ